MKNSKKLLEAAAELERRKRRKQPPTRDQIEHNLHILNKDLQIVPYLPKPAQLHFLANRTRRDLILKARQMGFSTTIQGDHFASAVTETALIATLAHDDATTQKLRRMAKRFYDYLPDNLRPLRGLDNATTTTYPQTGSEVTIATAGSLAAGRGGTYSKVHGSEVAFWKDAESIMAGLLQGVPKSGEIALESTPNGANGWFFLRCMEALDGKGVWKLHFYAWWWEADYRLPLEPGESLEPYSDEEIELIATFGLVPEQIKWRRDKIRELGRLFKQEYPENPRDCFLLSGQSYFGDLTGVFIVPYHTKFERNHRHIAGLDFAQTHDFTTLVVWDMTAKREVDALHINKLPWEEMRRQALEMCRKWAVSTLVYEQNSMGSTNGEALQKEARAMGMRDIQIIPFNTTPETKPDILAELHRALHEEGWKLLNDEIGRREMNAFIATQNPVTLRWRFEAQEGEHDDFVAARWCAKYATRMSGSMILFGA